MVGWVRREADQGAIFVKQNKTKTQSYLTLYIYKYFDKIKFRKEVGIKIVSYFYLS